MGTLRVGTASWSDRGLIEHWYPDRLKAKERLPWYADRFELVELNSSFYALPSRENVEGWVEATPQGFSFDVKLHRLLSRHATKPDSLPNDLREGLELNPRGNIVLEPELEREMVRRTREAFEPFAEAGKLGSFLLQLTPAFAPGKHDLAELDDLIEGLSPHLVAVELRHRGWLEGERSPRTLDYLADRGAVFVSVDAPREPHVPILPSIDVVTREELAYLRCHGRDVDRYMRGRTVAERFEYDYADDELVEIADRAQMLGEQAREVHAVFNNNARDLPTKSARRLREILGQDPGPEVG